MRCCRWWVGGVTHQAEVVHPEFQGAEADMGQVGLASQGLGGWAGGWVGVEKDGMDG